MSPKYGKCCAALACLFDRLKPHRILRCMTQSLYKHSGPLRNFADLRAAIEHVWTSMSQVELHVLKNAMGRRCSKVLGTNGRAMHY